MDWSELEQTGVNSNSLNLYFEKCLEMVSRMEMKLILDCWLWRNGDGMVSACMVRNLRWELDNLSHQLLEGNLDEIYPIKGELLYLKITPRPGCYKVNLVGKRY